MYRIFDFGFTLGNSNAEEFILLKKLIENCRKMLKVVDRASLILQKDNLNHRNKILMKKFLMYILMKKCNRT